MKLLEDQTERWAEAGLVIETVLLGIRAIDRQVKGSETEVTVPQFRMLAFLHHHEGASLSALAEHIGFTLPSASNAVDGMVKRGLVSRTASPTDRRKVTLSLTEVGDAAFKQVIGAIRNHFINLLDDLPEEDRASVAEAMRTVRGVFLSTAKCTRNA